MLKITHTDRYVDYAGTDEEESVVEHTVVGNVKLADGKVIEVYSVVTRTDTDGYMHVGVQHDAVDYKLYRNEEFPVHISNLIGTEVDFTEEGMQDDEYASLENQQMHRPRCLRVQRSINKLSKNRLHLCAACATVIK